VGSVSIGWISHQECKRLYPGEKLQLPVPVPTWQEKIVKNISIQWVELRSPAETHLHGSGPAKHTRGKSSTRDSNQGPGHECERRAPDPAPPSLGVEVPTTARTNMRSSRLAIVTRA